MIAPAPTWTAGRATGAAGGSPISQPTALAHQLSSGVATAAKASLRREEPLQPLGRVVKVAHLREDDPAVAHAEGRVHDL